ncbi:cellulose biosynthesis regulator diguanylate cyclase DgcQ [Cronobacter turicensis]|uniref:cellulose biosynthesis regulator diguanylate cyclase DgcQ n=1 Tax=Cronobacter turicensis TaxID=413502 RepID=UPI000CFD216F|nr:cellulose biosynthesis regulator diguanylate cyclase DgcQ [Cronobacter turicensis]
MPDKILISRWRTKNPIRVVNFCFCVVFIFSTLLTWREGVILQDAFISSQRNQLDSIATAMDRNLQYSVDKLLFYRAGMRYAMHNLLEGPQTDAVMAGFNADRHKREWTLPTGRDLAPEIQGVSDAFIAQSTLLERDEALLYNELNATLALGHMLSIADARSERPEVRTFYVSRAGFYLTNLPFFGHGSIPELYYQQVSSRWFLDQSLRRNPGRGVRWLHGRDLSMPSGQRVTASIPLDDNGRWFGVLAMDFPIPAMRDFLKNALNDDDSGGEILLFDRQLSPITTTSSRNDTALHFTAQDKAALARQMELANEGDARMDTRFIAWAKLDYFDGVLVKVTTVSQSAEGKFGKVAMVLGLLWLLFTAMLFISWRVIVSMVRNMLIMQRSLKWRAWYDTLTRLYNRGAFFERARLAAKTCDAQQAPFSVIQLDLDHFKSINDRYGHQAGDKVLTWAAGMLSRSLRAEDIAGRVGGEEFCIILPGTPSEGARQVAERIRQRINSQEILVRPDTTIRISVSVGVSEALRDGDYDFEHLQSIADRRLYLAKQRGRNQVCDEG